VADWRQIRARIRRAKSGPDATARLEQLFDKTRDGMVAFELAQLEETAGRTERATDWYKRAWLRFRRSEWKQKAEEALTRHGIPIPTDGDEDLAEEAAAQEPEAANATAESSESFEEPEEKEPEREKAAASEPEARAKPEPKAKPKALAKAEAEAKAEPEPEAEPASEGEAEAKPETAAGHRRRRRRGGRGRGRRKERGEAAERPAAEAAPHAPARPPAPRVKEAKEAKEPKEAKETERRPAAERRPARERVPAIHIYRRGEPALASEIKALEAKLRQLLASHPYPLDQLAEVPASPGVYLVSDLDLTTMYHLEAFGNMRQAMDQLVSGRRGRQGSVRARLARYLGISDSQASRYLKQHCVVRWIELEVSDAVALGHFAMALLRPELMEDTA
jgi:chemotaxis protein histidine kinase CheA